MQVSLQRAAIVAIIAATTLLAVATSADAGNFWRRGNQGTCYYQTQTRYYYQTPATQTQSTTDNGQVTWAPQTASTQYQSFSFEPGTNVQQPVTQTVPQAGYQYVPRNQPESDAGSYYRGDYRVEPGSTVPNMFRADRKILGLQSN